MRDKKGDLRVFVGTPVMDGSNVTSLVNFLCFFFFSILTFDGAMSQLCLKRVAIVSEIKSNIFHSTPRGHVGNRVQAIPISGTCLTPTLWAFRRVHAT